MLSKFSILVFILITIGVQSQEIRKKDLRALERLGLEYDALNTDMIYSLNLNAMLRTERMRKRRKRLGYIFGGLGVATVAGGAASIIINNRNNKVKAREQVGDYYNDLNEASAYSNLLSSYVIVIGVIEMGVSVPLFVSSSRNKKRRDKLIKKLNPGL